MATAAHARKAKPYAAREIAACTRESQVRHGESNCGIVIAAVLECVMAHSYMMDARPAWNSISRS